MDKPMKNTVEMSSSSKKYLQRLQVISNDNPFKTRVIRPKSPEQIFNDNDFTMNNQPIFPEKSWNINRTDKFSDQHSQSSKLCWEDERNYETIGKSEEISNLEVYQESKSMIESSFTIRETDSMTVITDIEPLNITQNSFEIGKSSSNNNDFLNAPPRKRSRHYSLFNDEGEFLPKSDFTDESFLRPLALTNNFDTEALFGESSKAVRLEQTLLIKNEMSGHSLMDNFSFNELYKNVSITCDDYNRTNIIEESLIDDTMMPESCRNGLLEKTLLQNKNVVVNSAYTTRSLMKTSRHVIDSFYKLQIPNDWKEVAENMKKMMEPNFDYLQAKLFPDVKVDIGKEQFIVNLIEEAEAEEIDESLEEIGQSFNTTYCSIIASTPNKSLIRNQSIVEENSEHLDANLVDDENEGQSKSVPNIEENQPSVNSLEATVVVEDQDQSEKNFKFSIVDPADFMFSRNLFADLPIINDDQENEPELLGFSKETLCAVERTEENQNSQKMSTLLEVFSLQSVELADKRRAAIITQLGNIFHSLLQSLVHKKPMVLKIRTIRSWKDCEMNNEVLSQNETKITTKSINFSNKASERTFTITLTIMCEIYKMLMRNLTCAKRELYYRDVELFSNQESVNRALDTICSMLNVQEYELGIVSSSKGLICGNLIINIGDERIDCSSTRAVPQNPSGITSFESDAEFVLVVEKDTVFQRLVSDSVDFKHIKTKIILVTAKGFPDVNTRVLLKKMSQMLDKPIYILVDADPFGIEIMCTYKYGSLMKVHNSEHLAVPDIKWIGIHPSDIDSLDIIHVDLTEADLKKVDELMKRPYMNPFLKSQLKCLKYRRLKAEIESFYLYSIDFLINEYIPRKIRTIELPSIP